jgi:hypothetical protein
MPHVSTMARPALTARQSTARWLLTILAFVTCFGLIGYISVLVVLFFLFGAYEPALLTNMSLSDIGASGGPPALVISILVARYVWRRIGLHLMPSNSALENRERELPDALRGSLMTSTKRDIHPIVLKLSALVAAVIIAGCATQPMPATDGFPGFWSGLLHGFTILFSLIGSIFTDWRIYAFPNSGGWYDFGYFLGASMFLGGGGAGARR